MKKLILFVLIGALAVFLLIQLVPYGRQHTNPPVVQEPNWTTPEARQLAQRAPAMTATATRRSGPGTARPPRYPGWLPIMSVKAARY